MTCISSLAMWFSNIEGKIIIEWYGWQITTSPLFFIIALSLSIFLIYILFSFIVGIINIPKNSLLKIKKRKTERATRALNEGIIASFYGNKKEVLNNLNIAKKSLNKSPLLILLELQNSLYKGDQKNTFIILTKMLDINILKPLAIKSLLSYSIKNKDKKLFNNILNKSLNKKIDFSWIQKDVFRFCIENNNWNETAKYLEKKIKTNNRINKEILSIVYFQVALEHYFLEEKDNAKIFLKRALNLNNFFPPFMELYCKINSEKSTKELIKVLKKYWLINPNPNIEKCIESCFEEENTISRLKITSKILVKNNHLHYKYLILGKFKYKAKIWGASRNDLKKSISFKPSKEAYYFLYKIEEDLRKNKKLTEEFKLLHEKNKNSFYWKCFSCNMYHQSWYPYCKSCNTFNSIKIINTGEGFEFNKRTQLIKSH